MTKVQKNLSLNPRYVANKSEKEEVQHRRNGGARSTIEVLEIKDAGDGASSHDLLIIHECGRLSTKGRRSKATGGEFTGPLVSWLISRHNHKDTKGGTKERSVDGFAVNGHRPLCFFFAPGCLRGCGESRHHPKGER